MGLQSLKTDHRAASLKSSECDRPREVLKHMSGFPEGGPRHGELRFRPIELQATHRRGPHQSCQVVKWRIRPREPATEGLPRIPASCGVDVVEWARRLHGTASSGGDQARNPKHWTTKGA